MSNDYIKQFMATLPDFQREKITQLLGEKQDAGKIKSESEYRRELEKLLAKLGENEAEPTMKLRPQSGRTNSRDYNDTFEEIGIDLTAVFLNSDQISKALSKHQQLNASVVRKIKQSIKQMNDEVDRYMMLVNNNEGFVESFYEAFRDISNIERERKYYTDRGVLVPDKYTAVIDATAETVRLAAASSHNCLVSPGGSQLAQIQILKQAGGGFIGTANQTNDINKAIDRDPETFWGEVILSDGEMQIDFDVPGITRGAFCEFEVVFNSLSVVSEITISPFTEFPMDVVSIRAYEGLDSHSNMAEILRPIDTISIEDPYTFQFPAVEARKVVFVFNQRHHRENTYLVRASERNNLEMWQKIADSEKEVTLDGEWTSSSEGENPTIAQDFLNSVSGWDLYQEKLKEFETLVRKNESAATVGGFLTALLTAGAVVLTGGAITPALALGAVGAGIGAGKAAYEGFLIGDNFQYDKLIEVTKNEYIYGAYDIDINGRDYYPYSVYVSKPLTAPGNVSKIILEATERHPRIPGSDRRATSIEYYITNVDDPDEGDWYPILPMADDKVFCERLFLESDSTAHLRFKVANSDQVTVYCNDRALEKNEDYVIKNNENRTTIFFTEMQSDAIYTADYLPTDSAWELDLTADKSITRIKVNERFETGANRNGTIQLEHYPFIDFEKINTAERGAGYDPNQDYTPLAVTLEGAIEWKSGETQDTALPLAIAGDGPATKNMTDYTSNVQSSLQAYDPEEYPYFEYRQDGRKLYFSESFNSESAPGGGRTRAAINVEYTYLASNLRLKAILRRNTKDHESITPALVDYTVKYKTSNMR